MILYVDTSAFVPLLIGEPTSDVCGQLWDGADRVVATRLLYVEAAAAMVMAKRLGRISARQHNQGYASLSELWTEVDVIELDAQLMTSAGEMSPTSTHFVGTTRCTVPPQPPSATAIWSPPRATRTCWPLGAPRE